jgi:lipopolysaccharide/colanic/teichoic acid biosynthesis glycosyltransferase
MQGNNLDSRQGKSMYAETDAVIDIPQPKVEPTLARTPGGAPRGEHGRPACTSACAVPVTWYRSGKRILDIALALVIVVVATPIILLAALLVKLTSRGPAFYSQTRVGRGGRPFTIFKIRSMYHNCEVGTGAQWSRKGDPRVMPVGRFLRRAHIDELPQLWNIFKGEMSLVGPRPERPEFVPQLELAIEHYRDRLLVLPGVTGLAQIHLGPDTDLASVERKLSFDLYYIKHLSFWADLRIILATAFHVVKPFVANKWFFRLTPPVCAEDIRKDQGPKEALGSDPKLPVIR